MVDSDLPRIFVDADVLIAGSASTSGASHLLLRLGELGLIELVCSPLVRGEAERNLTAKLPRAVPMFRALVDVATTSVDHIPGALLDDVSGEADPKDSPNLAAAIASGCSSLVTFNTRHCRPRGRDIRVETPGELVRRIRATLGRLGE